MYVLKIAIDHILNYLKFLFGLQVSNLFMLDPQTTPLDIFILIVYPDYGMPFHQLILIFQLMLSRTR